MSRPVTWSKTVTFFEDDWHEGNVPIMGVRTHAAWLCTSVFDGARAFEGVAPDLACTAPASTNPPRSCRSNRWFRPRLGSVWSARA